jgi:hypothetical protein
VQRVIDGRPRSGPRRDLLVGDGAPHVLDACREFQVPRGITGQPPEQRRRGCQTDRTQRARLQRRQKGRPPQPAPGADGERYSRALGEQHLQREQCQPPLPHVVVKVTDNPLPARVDLDRAGQGEDLGFQVGQTGKTDKSAKRVGPRNARNISLQLRSRRIYRGPGFALDCGDNGLVCDGKSGEFGQ